MPAHKTEPTPLPPSVQNDQPESRENREKIKRKSGGNREKIARKSRETQEEIARKSRNVNQYRRNQSKSMGNRTRTPLKFGANFRLNRRLFSRTLPTSGAILHYLCIFNGKIKNKAAIKCAIPNRSQSMPPPVGGGKSSVRESHSCSQFII